MTDGYFILGIVVGSLVLLLVLYVIFSIIAGFLMASNKKYHTGRASKNPITQMVLNRKNRKRGKIINYTLIEPPAKQKKQKQQKK
ncbi:MAG: hypothetical protein LBM65_06000 [Oscillospiraceae bacterium]|jgi:hypothetical protein|nr:hypothetical protein [Oscillospiraceae bacterium]